MPELAYLEKFAHALQQTLPQQFVGLSQYGLQSQSLALILTQADINTLATLKKICEKFQKPSLRYHLLTVEELTHALDVFPIEFLEMKETNQLIAGQDVVATLSIDLKNLRQECEFYLRSHVMKLREGYLQPNAQISALIRDALPSFLSVFRAFHVCQNRPLPQKEADIITSLSQKLSFNQQVFQALFQAQEKENLAPYFGDFLQAVSDITRQIDAF